jgi:glucose/arabinose dehydrogenase
MQGKFCTGAALAAATVIAMPAAADVSVNLEPVANGLTAPLGLAQPEGDDRIFIYEQPGRVRILQNGDLLDEPFLDIRHKIVTLLPDFDERGLLGMTFHPDFAENGKFYLAYSHPLDWQGDIGKKLWWSHTNIVAEFTVSEDDPNQANILSERIITSIDWPQFNHNGHWIGFGPDGYLYISTGDGGYANDWGIGHNPDIGNGQDPASHHGKILRVDVDNPSEGRNYGIPDDNPFVDDPLFLPEIYAMGLRNPWRCSFDQGGNNGLICGDVGQNAFETIVVVNSGDNHGWRAMEGTHCFDYLNPNMHPEDCDTAGYTMPVIEYNNCNVFEDCHGLSVTGGYVYRGDHDDWDGVYFFGDWSRQFAVRDGVLYAGRMNDNGEWSMEDVTIENMPDFNSYILAFGQDNDGNVYVMPSDTTGPVGALDTVYQITPAN